MSASHLSSLPIRALSSFHGTVFCRRHASINFQKAGLVPSWICSASSPSTFAISARGLPFLSTSTLSERASFTQRSRSAPASSRVLIKYRFETRPSEVVSELMADKTHPKGECPTALNRAKLFPSLLSLFPPVHFACLARSAGRLQNSNGKTRIMRWQISRRRSLQTSPRRSRNADFKTKCSASTRQRVSQTVGAIQNDFGRAQLPLQWPRAACGITRH